jgi:hypothetical protein
MHNPFNYLTFSSIVKYFQTETKLFLLSSIHYNTSTTLLKNKPAIVHMQIVLEVKENYQRYNIHNPVLSALLLYIYNTFRY